MPKTIKTISSYEGIRHIAGDPLGDLRFARSLCQLQLNEGNVLVAAAYAQTVAKLAGPACQWGLQSGQLLTKSASSRLMNELAGLLADFMREQLHPDEFEPAMERIYLAIGERLEQDR